MERELRLGRASLGHGGAGAAAGRVRDLGRRSAHADTRDRGWRGTNSLWLAERGFEVLGIDVAPLAVERARAKLGGHGLACRFATLDILAADPPDGPFHFVFDRGCFHLFDEPDERARFAAALAPRGLWLSLIGSTEGPPREVGPPRRSAREVALAVEPALEIIELRSSEFRDHGALAWFCLARRRTMPAQSSYGVVASD
ncbi:class I SAM-dependent methyltransferase [Acidobacteria bacterium AB60]|nr:class I SAM-dependent methyltransferase [Acidobacteria bacterium AB60]